MDFDEDQVSTDLAARESICKSGAAVHVLLLNLLRCLSETGPASSVKPDCSPKAFFNIGEAGRIPELMFLDTFTAAWGQSTPLCSWL